MEADLQQKEAFFQLLYNSDDSPTTDCEFATFLQHSRTPTVSVEPRLTADSPQPARLGRTVSAPVASASSFADDVGVVRDTIFPSKSILRTRGLELRVSLPGEEIAPSMRTPTAMPKGSRKRKRANSLDLLPESQQIFRGLGFFFLPNDEVSKARKFRMRRALEWGAKRIQHWGPDTGITHIIADNDLTYKDVISYLKVTALPSTIVLVNENYPSSCMSGRYLFNPLQRQYQLDGQQEALVAQRSSASTASSLVSLPLKPSRAHPPQTPSRTEGSSEIAVTRILDTVAKEAAEQEKLEVKRTKARAVPSSALDEAIEEARELEFLPLDSSEEDQSADSDLNNGSDEEERRSKKPKMTHKGSFNKSWQENFSCMKKHDGVNKDDNPNARTIEILQKMADYYERTQDHWRLTAYRKAIGALRKQSNKITTKEEAFAIPFIGERLAEKIEEVVWTNRLRRLDNAELEPNDKVLQIFVGIYGVGHAQASTWISQGYRTLEDLSSKANLTKNQRIGLDHYNDFNTRIPRTEVERHGVLVRKVIASVDPAMEVTIGGSFRRGASDSGDIDYLLTAPTLSLEALRTLLLESIIPRLFILNYLKCALATTSPTTGTKWHGAASIPTSNPRHIWRRVDFLLVPYEEMGAALIYFTGNDIFNRSIRLLASKNGMRLNQRGLWKDVMRGPGREKLTEGTLVEGKSEKRIFEILGVPWRPPEHRIC